MKLNRIAASAAALLLSALCIPLSVYAAQGNEGAAVTEAAAETTTEVDWQGLKDEYLNEIEKLDKESTTKFDPSIYYDDDHYDTDGNASLIDSQIHKVIFSNEQLLFTSVTTKDGNVFYVIIDYADKDGKDNVYFLNNVNSTYGHSKIFEIAALAYARALCLSASSLSRNL